VELLVLLYLYHHDADEETQRSLSKTRILAYNLIFEHLFYSDILYNFCRVSYMVLRRTRISIFRDILWSRILPAGVLGYYLGKKLSVLSFSR